LQIKFQYGDIGYRSSYLDLYHLQGGELLPLDEIIFHTQVPWCVIDIYELRPADSVIEEDGVMRVETAPAPVNGVVPPEDRICRKWFLPEDINKAETVKYLENGSLLTANGY
jgi:hypothetical protein